MADNYVLFSEIVPRLNAEERAWVERLLSCSANDAATAEPSLADLLAEDPAAEGGVDLDDVVDWPGFNWSFVDGGEGDLWLYSEESENVTHVAAFVRAFLRRFRPTDVWTLTWAETCSKAHPGEFGGGGAFVTADTIELFSAHDWLAQRRWQQQQQQQTT